MELLRIDCRGFVLPVFAGVTGRESAMACPSPGLIILPVLTLNTTRISIQFIDELQTLRQIITFRTMMTAQQNWQTCQIVIRWLVLFWLDHDIQPLLEHVDEGEEGGHPLPGLGPTLGINWSGTGCLWPALAPAPVCEDCDAARRPEPIKIPGQRHRRPEPVEHEAWVEDVSTVSTPSTWVTPSSPSPPPPPSESRSVSLYSNCVSW